MVSLVEESTEEVEAEEVKIKPFDRVAETVLKLKKTYVGIKGAMKAPLPPLARPEGTFRLFSSALILTLLGIALLSFLLIREFSKHRQTLLELGQAEQARSKLEQSLSQLHSEMAHQQKRIERLGVGLEKANAKAALIDQLRRDHETELARLQTLYEGQLADLRKLLQTREDLANRLQSLLEAMHSISQGGGLGLALPDSVPLTKTATDSRGTPSGEAGVPSHKRISGKVALVDRGNRFIIVTFGAVDGAVVGDFVKIYQGEAELGDGRIERVYHHLSAATVTSEDTLTRVQKGDSVFLALF